MIVMGHGAYLPRLAARARLSMSLNESNLSQELIAWVARKHGGALACPICHVQRDDNWVAERITTSTPYQDPHERYDLVCQTCGYTLAFAPQIVARRS
jgi:hypothetical protein